MKIMRLPLPCVVALLVCNVAFAQYKVGDTVIVIHNHTPITVGEKVVGELNIGPSFTVEAVNGNWLWITYTSAGWVNKQYVATPAGAIAVFTERIRQDPENADNYYASRGNVWQEQGEFEIAIGDFNEAIRLSPTAGPFYTGRGQCWLDLGRVDKAIADFTVAIQDTPEGPISLASQVIAYDNRANAWNLKSEFDKAISDATEAIRLAPTDAYAYGVRAAAWAGKKQFEKARADCETSQRLSPKASLGYMRVGRLLATSPNENCRDGQKAIEFAVKGNELAGGKMTSVLDTLAAAYAETGDFEKAVEWQTKALAGASSKRDRANYEERLDLYKSGKPYRQKLTK